VEFREQGRYIFAWNIHIHVCLKEPKCVQGWWNWNIFNDQNWHLIFRGQTQFKTSRTFYNELIKYISYLGYNFEIHRKPYGINYWFDYQSTCLNLRHWIKNWNFLHHGIFLIEQQIPESWHLIFHGQTQFKTSRTFCNELIKYISYLGYNFEIHWKPYGINFWFDYQSTCLNLRHWIKNWNFLHHGIFLIKQQNYWTLTSYISWSNSVLNFKNIL